MITVLALFAIALIWLVSVVAALFAWLWVADRENHAPRELPDAGDADADVDFERHAAQAVAIANEPFAAWSAIDELQLRRWQKEHQR